MVFSHLTLHDLQQTRAYIVDPSKDVDSTVTTASARTPLNDLFATCQANLRPLFHQTPEPSASITLGHPSNLAALYEYITKCLSQPDPRTVHCRFREFCLKHCVKIGILKVASAVSSLVAMTQPGYIELISNREFRAIDSPIRGNGDSFLVAVYPSEDTSRMMANWDQDSQLPPRGVASGFLLRQWYLELFRNRASYLRT
ncbi:hypothetical protein BCON_0124g00040 [Botryotinia convoluta]|uniref:Uncharacterized protein n=1 Tax=Botryotinia convoluta TaxID=54673 RepID=A0A4Z1I9R9_9HELO|nr:hypothetical protein BCON_0124g00040 [Botryotinia convoluta]